MSLRNGVSFERSFLHLVPSSRRDDYRPGSVNPFISTGFPDKSTDYKLCVRITISNKGR
jgi:hypothetical protein